MRITKVTIEVVNAALVGLDGVRVLVDGKVVATGQYGGEPEDNRECRDYSWVKESLRALAEALGAEAQIKFTDLATDPTDITGSNWREAEKKQTTAFYDALYRKDATPMTTKTDVVKLRAAAQAATKGPWAANLDVFNDEDGIVACVVDSPITMLVQIGTDIPLHHVPDDGRWTAEDDAKRDAQWEKARQSQALRDANYLAAASPDVVLSLLDRLEQLESALGEACDWLDGEGYDPVALRAIKEGK